MWPFAFRRFLPKRSTGTPDGIAISSRVPFPCHISVLGFLPQSFPDPETWPKPSCGKGPKTVGVTLGPSGGTRLFGQLGGAHPGGVSQPHGYHLRKITRILGKRFENPNGTRKPTGGRALSNQAGPVSWREMALPSRQISQGARRCPSESDPSTISPSRRLSDPPRTRWHW